MAEERAGEWHAVYSTLLAERDALEARVRELEGERDKLQGLINRWATEGKDYIEHLENGWQERDREYTEAITRATAVEAQVKLAREGLEEIAAYTNPETEDDFYERNGDGYLLQAVKVARDTLDRIEQAGK